MYIQMNRDGGTIFSLPISAKFSSLLPYLFFFLFKKNLYKNLEFMNVFFV